MIPLHKALVRVPSSSKTISLLGVLHKWAPLFLVSSLSLFVELAMIRWVSGEVRLFAYFKNLPLMAAFLGLSIGFALVGRGRDYHRTLPVLFAIFTFMVIGFSWATADRMIIYPGGGDEFYWFPAQFSFWVSLTIFLAVVVVFFLMIMFLFIPLGQLVGDEMARHRPVQSYVVNILASLVGVWIFTVLSYLRTSPLMWFGLFVAGFAFYWIQRFQVSWVMLAFLAAPLVAIGVLDVGATWSPYSRLSMSEKTLSVANGEAVKIGYELDVQQVFYQNAIDLSDEFIHRVNSPELAGMAVTYNLPYQLVNPGSKSLIVGAGMGNDAAAALRNNMGSVKAVEIDPSIVQFGRKYHPERPYDDPRVQIVIDDARSYFNNHGEKFDVIVFGLLDSHSLLSSVSSVRLDSYVYTLESFQQVKKLLNNEGIVALTFATNNTWIGERLGRMLASIFGVGQVYYYEGDWGTTYIVGSVSDAEASLNHLEPWKANPSLDSLPLTSDDWPYLYMHGRKIPAAYWQSLLLIGVLCIFLISRSFPEAMRPSWHFWLLGAAFLLIEVKSITELALLFGTTWLVNSFAISGVLLMALVANLLVLRIKRINLRFVYLLLFISLAFNLFFPLSRLADLITVLRGVVSTAVLTLPLLFAGIIFSESLRRYGDTSKPLASNFSGSVFGGMLEYASIWWGVKSLSMIAIVLYAGALLANRFRK
jgi:SAM-dependent methyltransferase